MHHINVCVQYPGNAMMDCTWHKYSTLKKVNRKQHPQQFEISTPSRCCKSDETSEELGYGRVRTSWRSTYENELYQSPYIYVSQIWKSSQVAFLETTKNEHVDCSLPRPSLFLHTNLRCMADESTAIHIQHTHTYAPNSIRLQLNSFYLYHQYLQGVRTPSGPAPWKSLAAKKRDGVEIENSNWACFT